MKHILVPTDFSGTAENAVNFSIQTAKIFPAAVTLLHSYEVIQSFSVDYLGVNREFTLSMLNDIEKQLDAERERILGSEGVEVDTFISTYPLYQSIAKAANEKKADWIVMGTLGASGIKEKIWGSRTSSVIGKTKIPVMVIPDQYQWKKPQKILFATNKFEKDPGILNFIFELAGLYMANIQVTVFTDADDEKTEKYIDNQKRMDDYKQFLNDRYNEEALTAIHLYGEEFGATLQDYIEDNEVDILVMVTYQSDFWTRIFNPSITKRMSYHTRIPLLAIPGANS